MEKQKDEIVHCGECKHWDNREDIGWCNIHSHFECDSWNSFEANDFCSCGGRKDINEENKDC